MKTRRYQVMYILTLDGKPVTIGWGIPRDGRKRRTYYLVGETGFDVPVFKSLRTVREHAKVAQRQIMLARPNQVVGTYGYVMLSVPS